MVELVAQQAARHGFEVVGHDARRAFGVQAEQQVTRGRAQRLKELL
jgi:hypothetical protein